MSQRNVRKRSMPLPGRRRLALRQQDQDVDVGAGMQLAAAVAADRDQRRPRARRRRRAGATRLRSTTSTMRRAVAHQHLDGLVVGEALAAGSRRRQRARRGMLATRIGVRCRARRAAPSRNGHGGSATAARGCLDVLGRADGHVLRPGGCSFAPSVSTSSRCRSRAPCVPTAPTANDPG